MTNQNAYKDNAYFQKSIKNPDFLINLIKLAKKADILEDDKEK